MKVIRARVLGFCMGVRRAVEIALDEAKGVSGHIPVYTLGPLIHNPQVLETLKDQGIAILQEGNFDDLKGKTVLIRAHGVNPQVEERLLAAGARVRDVTCPRVKKSQMEARSLTEAGYCLFLAGEKDHGEIIGIQGYAPDCVVVANPPDAEAAAEKLHRQAPQAKTALLGQTTLSADEYGAIGERIRKWFPELKIIDTICGATRDRQNALKELCSCVDAVIIAGGKTSANTRRLLSIAQSLNKPAWLVENEGEIPGEIGTYAVVGLSAGASTPDTVIDAVEKALYAL
ncbi:4-hydroxy-3-methylbut-2-enyl diphosphate reductase [Treponema sp. TIM-1]|uniref:4-hydroxy-3-methylbut-2-enyl diphosphate reductase n=1 Tax=Treponema sp. TIM-1 TaxID=2898417 RepID=UPI00397F465F